MHDVLCLRMSDSGSRDPNQEYPMAVITFANTKGGAGKTTAALLLATELLHRNHRVCVLDADPQRWFSRWQEGAPLIPRLSVETYVSTDDGSLGDGLVLHQHRLQVAGIDVEAAGDDHVLGAVDDEQVAIGIHPADVARVVPAALARLGAS